MAEEWVQMKHPDLGDRPPSRVSKKSFDLTWKKIGWKLAKKKEN